MRATSLPERRAICAMAVLVGPMKAAKVAGVSHSTLYQWAWALGMGAGHDLPQARHGWVDEAPAAEAVRRVWEAMTLTDQRVERAPEGELRAALRESYAVLDHLTTGHRARGCNASCDWWPRVEAIRGRNK